MLEKKNANAGSSTIQELKDFENQLKIKKIKLSKKPHNPIKQPSIYYRSDVASFTVLCSFTRPVTENDTEFDLALIQTSILFLCKLCCCNTNGFSFTYQEV